MSAFDPLASAFEEGRIGYASDLYDALVAFGLRPRQRVLDVGCGSGLASAPLIENGFSVTGIDASEPMLAIARRTLPAATYAVGRAEQLPFDAAGFDAVICAQAFHLFDRRAAMRELLRVVRPNGIVALWWKHLMAGDSVKILRDEVARDLGFELPEVGLEGGFKEFYSAPFAEHTLRVIPWRTTMPLSSYLQYEHSRANVRAAFGTRVGEYFASLETRMRERFGTGNPSIPFAFVHYLYLGKLASGARS